MIDPRLQEDFSLHGYRLIREIGSGGMGTVYEAEQQRPRRIVALKVVRQGLTTPHLARRLEFEAQVLAHLKHPGIAQIHESGLFTSGGMAQSYFAMELIQGKPLSFSHQKNGPIAARLELLAEVCDAVEHAHQRGIIHRDLKPENIFVDANGRPKVLDFGLARSFDSDVEMVTTCRQLDEIAGTIYYMSPEQTEMRSERIDTRSDIYSLGVIGYELLTGEFPFAREGRTPFAYLCAINEETPRPASSFNNHLRGDIETILSRALMKEKELRYQSASEFAADIRRYLKDEPIIARPPTATYHLGKFAKRNKTLVAGVCATFLALAAGLIGTLSQARLAARRATLAESASVEANDMRAEADRMRDNAENEQYAAAIPFAQNCINQQRYALAADRLLHTPERLRNFEWGCLMDMAHPELVTLSDELGKDGGAEISPDGKSILVNSASQGTELLNALTGDRLRRFSGSIRRDSGPYFSPDAIHVLTVETKPDKVIARIWNTATGKQVAETELPAFPLHYAGISPDGQRAVFCINAKLAGGDIAIWNFITNEMLYVNTDSTAAARMAFNASGKRFVTAHLSDMKIWDMESGRLLLTIAGTTGDVRCLRFSPDATLIATSYLDGTARLWNAQTGGALMTLSGHEAPVETVRFSPDGRHLLTSSNDLTARVWDVTSGHTERILPGHRSYLDTAEYSSDGSLIATGGQDGAVRIWDSILRSS